MSSVDPGVADTIRLEDLSRDLATLRQRIEVIERGLASRPTGSNPCLAGDRLLTGLASFNGVGGDRLFPLRA